MTSDQQFYLQMAAILVGAIITIVGMFKANHSANQAVVQGVAATQSAQAAVAVSVENSKKADTLIERVVEVKTLADGNLSKVTASLEVALARIDGLQKMVASLTEAKVVADKVAERHATAPPVPPPRAQNERAADLTAPQAVVADEPLPVRVVAAIPVPVETESERADRPPPPPMS